MPKAWVKKGREYLPPLFSRVDAHLQRGADIYFLRSFRSKTIYKSRDVITYSRHCLLARMCSLIAVESDHDNSFFSLWRRHLSEPDTPCLPLLELLADLHVANGTWPGSGRCEQCGTRGQAQMISGYSVLLCQKCSSPQDLRLGEDARRWLEFRYMTREAVGLESPSAQLLTRLLARRLPDILLQDAITRRLMRDLDPEFVV